MNDTRQRFFCRLMYRLLFFTSERVEDFTEGNKGLTHVKYVIDFTYFSLAFFFFWGLHLLLIDEIFLHHF